MLTNWTDPGAGGFYDDLGELNAPHYVHNVSSETGDQSLVPTAILSTAAVSDQYYQVPPGSDRSMEPPHFSNPPMMRSQMTHVSTTVCIVPHPITMRYEGLPANTVYKVFLTADTFSEDATCTANGISCGKVKDADNGRKKFDVPAQATQQGGDLVLQFFKSTPAASNMSGFPLGRLTEMKFGGIIMSEVWLVVA